jgi:hypothetical protein
LHLNFLEFAMFFWAGHQLLSSLVLKPRDHFINVSYTQTEVQGLVVLSQPMLRHMDRHRDTRAVRTLRVLPLQLTQGNCAGGLSFLPRLVKHWFLKTALECPMIYAEH